MKVVAPTASPLRLLNCFAANATPGPESATGAPSDSSTSVDSREQATKERRLSNFNVGLRVLAGSTEVRRPGG